MSQKIKITAGNTELQAQLNDSPTAKSIAEKLPIEAGGQRWGGEIYFSVPIDANPASDSREVFEAGELGFGSASGYFCIFFGPTPISTGDKSRAASKVNPIGKINGDISGLWNVQSGDKITIEKA